jgi:histidinol-phosphate aminotransferase
LDQWIRWISQFDYYPNVSKAYGLAGIRLGICYASAEVLLNKIKPPYIKRTDSKKEL